MSQKMDLTDIENLKKAKAALDELSVNILPAVQNLQAIMAEEDNAKINKNLEGLENAMRETFIPLLQEGSDTIESTAKILEATLEATGNM